MHLEDLCRQINTGLHRLNLIADAVRDSAPIMFMLFSGG